MPFRSSRSLTGQIGNETLLNCFVDRRVSIDKSEVEKRAVASLADILRSLLHDRADLRRAKSRIS